MVARPLRADVNTIGPSLKRAEENLMQAGSDAEIEGVVADKVYSANETLAALVGAEEVRTYISEPKQAQRRNWKDKPEAQRKAVIGSR
jgi:hypothetical protein